MKNTAVRTLQKNEKMSHTHTTTTTILHLKREPKSEVTLTSFL